VSLFSLSLDSPHALSADILAVIKARTRVLKADRQPGVASLQLLQYTSVLSS
jgi:hypothetical protein